MGIRFFPVAGLLLLPKPAFACLENTVDPTFANGALGLAGYAVFAVGFTAAQRFVVKRQMAKAGAAMPESLGKAMAASNALVFSLLAMLFLAVAGLTKIEWSSIAAYLGS